MTTVMHQVFRHESSIFITYVPLHTSTVVVVAFVVPLSLSLLLSVCFLRVTCTLLCCTPPPCLASVFSFSVYGTAALSFFVAETPVAVETDHRERKIRTWRSLN